MSNRYDDDDNVQHTGTWDRYGAPPLDGPPLLDGVHGVTFQGQLFEAPPFEEMVTWYLAGLRAVALRKQSRLNEEVYLRAALRWLGERGIARPSTADWKAYFDWRLSPACPDKVTPSTVESYRATVRKVYKRCAEMPKPGWFLIPNPVSTAYLAPYYKPHHETRPRAIGNPDVTYPLIHAAMPDLLAKSLVELLVNQGLRIQEALAIPLPGGALEAKLGRRFLDLDARTLRVEFQRERDSKDVSQLKTGYSAATLRLVSPTVDALREALRWRSKHMVSPDSAPNQMWGGWAARAYVFPYFRKHLERLMLIHRKVAPADFRPRVRGEHGGDAWHVYRHTFATDLARNGVTKEEIHNLLRHRNMQTTDAYLRALLADVRGSDAVEEAARRRKERQAQAVEERSGKGLTVVPFRRDT